MIESMQAIKTFSFYSKIWHELKSGEQSKEIAAIEERFQDFEKPRFSIFATVRRIKEQRFGMVKTQKQYEFLYSYMEHYLSKNKLT
jgi:protein tyrosine phosphatase